MLEAEQQFRKIIGYTDLAKLAIAVERDLTARRSFDARPRDHPGGRYARRHQLTITGPPPRIPRRAGRLGAERVWAIEDCRHVSGALERFLLRRGERIVRVAPKLMAGARRSAREPGKSDAIDAVAIARAALREGLETLPIAQLAGPELDVRLLVDHRERLVAQRTALINDLRWHLHDRWPDLEIPPAS